LTAGDTAAAAGQTPPDAADTTPLMKTLASNGLDALIEPLKAAKYRTLAALGAKDEDVTKNVLAAFTAYKKDSAAGRPH
jgi:hypothetical protein